MYVVNVARIEDIEGNEAQSDDNRTMGFDWGFEDVTGWQKDRIKRTMDGEGKVEKRR